jgi:hypothetical protein
LGSLELQVMFEPGNVVFELLAHEYECGSFRRAGAKLVAYLVQLTFERFHLPAKRVDRECHRLRRLFRRVVGGLGLALLVEDGGRRARAKRLRGRSGRRRRGAPCHRDDRGIRHLGGPLIVSARHVSGRWSEGQPWRSAVDECRGGYRRFVIVDIDQTEMPGRTRRLDARGHNFAWCHEVPEVVQIVARDICSRHSNVDLRVQEELGLVGMYRRDFGQYDVPDPIGPHRDIRREQALGDVESASIGVEVTRHPHPHSKDSFQGRRPERELLCNLSDLPVQPHQRTSRNRKAHDLGFATHPAPHWRALDETSGGRHLQRVRDDRPCRTLAFLLVVGEA